ncbi:MAG: ATP-binding cassette domain-containing protein [Acidimicrobiaceae bacterium]|nr:ATP-binding cassette domain-containing protein [Acidimicrobiaceae bacterium]
MSGAAPGAERVLVVEDLVQEYFIPGREAALTRKNRFQAVAGVSFDLGVQETLGIVGETGCGKSTLARAIVQAPKPTSGSVLLDGVDLTKLGRKELHAKRQNLQLVFQDPYSSLDPRWKILQQVTEPLRIYGIDSPSGRIERAKELLSLVGLDPNRIALRRPRDLSGGECQRVVVARALTLSPRLIVLDEPVSSMDVSVQAQVLNLLEQLREELRLSYVFISHDLAVVKHVSDRVAVMHLGKFCEIAPAKAIYAAPFHPYSEQLVESMPDPRLRAPSSRSADAVNVPSPTDPPSGCRFRTRCPRAQALCAEVEPMMRAVGPEHFVACHFPLRQVGDETPVTLGARAGGANPRSTVAAGGRD